jgi:hypothetical protein
VYTVDRIDVADTPTPPLAPVVMPSLMWTEISVQVRNNIMHVLITCHNNCMLQMTQYCISHAVRPAHSRSAICIDDRNTVSNTVVTLQPPADKHVRCW